MELYVVPTAHDRIGRQRVRPSPSRITAVQVVTIEAVTATVEYGGNNNAAESTAEFKFTRYRQHGQRAELPK